MIGKLPGIIVFPLLILLATACTRPQPVALIGRTNFSVANPGHQRIGDVNLITLENGLTIIHRQTTVNSLIGLTAFIRIGSSLEDASQAGKTALLMETIMKGTTSRNAETIAEELASMGAGIMPDADRDFSTVSMGCVKDDFPEALDLLADVLLNPTFPTDQVELEKSKTLASIRVAEDQLPSYSWRRFEEALFLGHPYGYPLEGTPETLESLTPVDIGNTHRDFFVPSNMVVSVVGDISADEAERLLRKQLGTTDLEREPRSEGDRVITPSGGLNQYTKKSRQGFVIMGHLVCEQGHPDQPAVKVASALLGSGMSSRLFSDLRDNKGLAYSVGSTTRFLKKQGYFAVYIGTNSETIDKWFPPDPDADEIATTSNDLWQHLERLRDEPVGEDELERAKNYIAGSYLRSHETNLQQAAYLGYWHLTGRGIEYDREYLDQIRGVTARDIMRVSNKYFLEPTVVVVRPESTP